MSASIFQAVVNQTISGLACGKPIRGHVAFLGGPLHFLSELRTAFVRTLKLDDEHMIVPENSHLFAAIGSAMSTRRNQCVPSPADRQAYPRQSSWNLKWPVWSRCLSPSRNTTTFRRPSRHNVVTAICRITRATASRHRRRQHHHQGCPVGRGRLASLFLLQQQQRKHLKNNDPRHAGNLSQLPCRSAKIVCSCSTGYGEALVKSALMLDEGEVETVAHYYAAAFFDPEVDCILDIGGQDMKCIKIKNQTVDSVQLNEACSSGCGSFIETFAKSLNYSVQDFAKAALFAEHPIDLGTRCTVFMNSKVKQAQKEGAEVADISAGLAYSVIKNALYKVIKVSDASQLGRHIVVQGGTFYNDAVLRSFEKIAGCEAIRPDIAGIMGAFGAALIARERYTPGRESTMLSIEKINSLQFTTSMAKCKGCTNQCRLTINRFSGGRQFISGNRCERGLGKEKNKEKIPNLYDFKNKLLFSYTPLEIDEAPRGIVGIPRVLNMYENYPFWFTFFTKLGYRVILSPPSTRKIYELGIESIPSESECYPAKLSHGHVEWLIRQGIQFIFYPCIPYERQEVEGAVNHYNCPIVTSYAENIKNNVEALRTENIRFMCPFVAFTNLETASNQLVKVFGDLPAADVAAAAKAGWEEMARTRQAMYDEGQKTLKWMEENHRRGIVLAGRPYHVDPERSTTVFPS